MTRVKIIVPENKLALIKIPVRIGDINYGNHVGNDAFVSIIHEARAQWLSRHNFTELDVCGIGLIMSDLVIEFKKEAFYGDTVEVQLSAGEISRVGFELFYQLCTNRNEKNVLLVNAKTGMVCYNYQNKKITAIPEEFKKLITQN